MTLYRTIPLLLSVLACSSGSPANQDDCCANPIEAAAPLVGSTGDVDLTVHPVKLKLPQGSLPKDYGTKPFPLRGKPARTGKGPGYTRWSTALPFAADLMREAVGEGRSTGDGAPVGVTVRGPDGPLAWSAEGDRKGTWSWSDPSVILNLPGGAAPNIADYRIETSRVREAELHRQRNQFEGTMDAFARQQVGDRHEAYRGLFLPAPASATWTLPVQRGQVFDVDLRLLGSHSLAVKSDGAIAVLEHVADKVTELARVEVGKEGARLHAELDSIAGEEVTLRLRTLPGDTRWFDYIVAVDPLVHTPDPAPRHVVMLFLDTTRADHLGTYGYERDTSPAIDALAKEAVVFEANRTIAPWTLPSVRATLSGVQPEHWATTPTLAERLGEEGFATMASFTNTFMTAAFGMDRGWHSRWYRSPRPADAVVDQGLDFLRRHKDRDALVLLQFMDAHMPYVEPDAYRGRWADEPWEGPAIVTRSLRKLGPEHPRFDDVRDYVTGRYDQNIRFIDDQLARLFAEIRDDATIVIWGDHGEELWEHGGFEHGHTFYDELLRVPFILKAEGLEPRRVDTPTSLLDITPTVLDVLDLPADEDLHGTSALPLAQGDASAAEVFRTRPHAFGRPLQGEDGWGVIVGDTKWTTRQGVEAAFDLSADTEENADVSKDVDADTMRRALGEALNTEVVQVWRLGFTLPGFAEGLTLKVSHPKGLTDTWIAYQPRIPAPDPGPTVVDGVLTYTHPAGARMPRAFYVQPTGEPTDLDGLHIEVAYEGRTIDSVVTKTPPPDRLATRSTWHVAGEKGFRVLVQPSWIPLPTGEAIEAYAPEARAELEALGYVE